MESDEDRYPRMTYDTHIQQNRQCDEEAKRWKFKRRDEVEDRLGGSN